MPATPPVWDRVRIALGVLRAELAIFEWAADQTKDPALTMIAERLRTTVADLEQHPQMQPKS